ncbi:MAG: hypothetical protein O2895_01960, partial [Chloroflexi bacterium]|nr:hypothetical protein [Chloroflexota bacterium]
MSLGILIGTASGLYRFFPGEPLRCLIPEIAVASLDVQDGVALVAAAGRGVWLHEGDADPEQWRQIWEGDARQARIGPGGAYYLGTAPAGLLRSEDGGATWEPSSSFESVVRYQRTRTSSTGTPGRTGGPRGGSSATSQTASWALTAIAFLTDGVLVAVSGAGLWMSTDRGRSWMPRSEGIDPAVSGLYEHPERRDRVYATARSGLFRSDDGGYSWLQSLTGLDRSTAVSLSVLPGAPDALVLSAARSASGERGALFRSIDGGVRWTRLLVGDEDEWPH